MLREPVVHVELLLERAVVLVADLLVHLDVAVQQDLRVLARRLPLDQIEQLPNLTHDLVPVVKLVHVQQQQIDPLDLLVDHNYHDHGHSD